jgi:hypothetical protein
MELWVLNEMQNFRKKTDFKNLCMCCLRSTFFILMPYLINQLVQLIFFVFEIKQQQGATAAVCSLPVADGGEEGGDIGRRSSQSR